jgi:hypothetical protein
MILCCISFNYSIEGLFHKEYRKAIPFKPFLTDCAVSKPLVQTDVSQAQFTDKKLPGVRISEHQTVSDPFHKKPASGIGPKRRLLSCPLKVLFGEQLVHPGHHLEGVGDVDGIGLSLGSAAVGVGVDGPPLVYEANGRNEGYFALRSSFLIIQFSAPSIILTSLPIICSYVSSMSEIIYLKIA